MNKMLLGMLAGVATLTVSMMANASTETYELDPAHTFPHFSVNHLGFSTMRGRFNTTSGTVTMDKDKGTGSVAIEIDVSSIDTGHDKRNEHLRGPDFFNATEFPKMTYKSTKVTINKDNSAVVDGNLTIMGVTKPVTLNVEKMNCGVHPFNKKEVCGFDATATIKRSDFGMKYGLPAIGDEINMIIEAEGVKK
ncbi:MAG: YceI family protein [Gammaproteobacteria bacterium]|jgi:polyisoprenoid-binding protein YceI